MLATKVRPFLRYLIEALVEGDILVSIVTFSKQVDLIRELLYVIFKPDVASKIFIRGSDPDGKGIYGSKFI